ncbi:MAG: hypothetical protein ABI811_20350 [Acidobacteriota bacterium]
MERENSGANFWIDPVRLAGSHGFRPERITTN